MNDFSNLAQQQSDLLNAIFTTNKIAKNTINTSTTALNSIKNRGILTYRANSSALANRSLQAAYPVIAQLIGEEAFEHLAIDFWAQHPPVRGDLAQWGGDLFDFINRIEAFQSEPYLSDVANAEWALHTTAIAPDKNADYASFSLLTELDAGSVTLDLAPGTALIQSNYPVASLLAVHLYADERVSPSFDEVRQKLHDGTPEIAMIWRHGFLPRVSACSLAESELLTILLRGKSLLAAIELAIAKPDIKPFDFEAWLTQAVLQGLILGAKPISPNDKQ